MASTEDAIPDMAQYLSAHGEGAAEGGVGGEGSGNQPVITKLLVSNLVAGSVIGKAGANIEQLQRSSSARIQLSRAGEFYPGTSDRVLLLSGTLHSVLTAVFLILEKVARDQAAGRGKQGNNHNNNNHNRNTNQQYHHNNAATGNPGDREDEVKLALSRRLCGLLIGHKGVTVRDFISDSSANIRVQSLTELSPSDPERIITVMGARDQVLRAVALILNTLSLHKDFAPYMDNTMQLAQNQGVVVPPRAAAAKSALTGMRAMLILYVPDEEVGAILGRKGQSLIDIQQSARVVIKISDRSKMDPTTSEREVSIAGAFGGVKLAEAMIGERLGMARARNNREPADFEG